MHDSQVWTIIGVLGALWLAGVGWIHSLFMAKLESVRVEIGGLRAEMNSGFELLRQEISSGDERLELLLKLHEALHHHKEE